MGYKYDVSIIIVNYNGKRFIDNLFNSLVNLEHQGYEFEVIFVDNNSSDGSVEYIENNEAWNKALNIKLVRNKANLGFAGGNNTGVAAAEGEYIIFLNNDTVVMPTWMSELYKTIKDHDDYGIVASKLLFFYDFIRLDFSTNDNIKLQKTISINGVDYTIDNKFCKNEVYADKIICFGNTSIAIPLLQSSQGILSHQYNQDEWDIRDYSIKLIFDHFNSDTDKVIACGVETRINAEEVIVSIPADKVKKYKYSIIQNAGSGINGKGEGFDIGMGEPDSPKYDVPKKLTNGCGASIIMRKMDFEAVGGFDDKFFMYYEDTDLSFRIRKFGKNIWYCPTSLVRHIHTGSSMEWSSFFNHQVNRNKLLFVYKNIGHGKFYWMWLRSMIAGYKYNDETKRKAAMEAFRMVRSFYSKQ